MGDNMQEGLAVSGSTPTLESTITCPACGHRETETMPENACLWFYQCTSCGSELTPLPGDCCVFCSYGTVACPPVQRGDGCCG